MKYVYFIASWLFGLGLILLGMAGLMSSTIAGALLIAAGLVLLPPVRSAAFKRTAIAIPAQFRVATVVVLFLGALFWLSHQANIAEQAALAEKVAQEQQALEALRQEQSKEFQENRESIISEIQADIDTGDFTSALKTAQKYAHTGDELLTKLIDESNSALANIERERKTNEIIEMLKSIPASELQINKDLYQDLVDLNPDSSDYKSKLAHYSKKIADKEAAEAMAEAEKEKEQSERVARFGQPPIKSGWDGTYSVVESYLKRVANDPDSIELDSCTGLYHTEDGWLVGCDYRGRNAFGGMIRQSNWFTIAHGSVVEVHDASKYDP